MILMSARAAHSTHRAVISVMATAVYAMMVTMATVAFASVKVSSHVMLMYFIFNKRCYDI